MSKQIENIEELLSDQRNHFRAISRMVENFKKLGKSKMTEAVTQGRLQLLKEKWNLCQRLDCTIHAKVPPTLKDSNPYFTEEEFVQAEELFLEAYDFFQDKVRSFATDLPKAQSTILEESSTQESSISVRLPQIELPRFTGQYSDWSQFRDTFEALIHANPSLTDVQRLHYLKSALEGEAAQLLKHVSSSSANYASSWKMLIDRYENLRALVTAHLNILFSISSVSNDNLNGLKSLRDTTNQSIEMLRALKRPVESWSDLLVHMTLMKLDKTTIKEWEMTQGASTEFPTFQQLDLFLQARVRALEAIQAASECRSTKTDTRSNTIAPKKSSTTRLLFTSSVSSKCSLCDESHLLYQCNRFKELSVAKRKEHARAISCCFNCLRVGHLPASCPSKGKCQRCQRRHHTLLHLEGGSYKNSATTATSSTLSAETTKNQQVHPSMTVCSGPSSVKCERSVSSMSVSIQPIVNNETFIQNVHLPASFVHLATAMVRVTSSNGRQVVIRALLDQGSEATFVGASVVQLLRAKRYPTSVRVSGVGDSRVGTAKYRVDLALSSLFSSGRGISITALVLPRLTSYRVKPLNVNTKWSHLADLSLADPFPNDGRNVDMIIGADYYGSLLLPGLRQGSKRSPTAQATVFGWVLSGPNNITASSPNMKNCATHSFRLRVDSSNERLSLSELGCSISRFWEIEETPCTHIWSEEDNECEMHFRKTHSRMSDGRYVVRLPFRNGDPPTMGESLDKASRLLRKNQVRLQKNPELLVQYSNFLQEYEKLGHMRLLSCPTDSSLERSYPVYLPHHPVIRKNAPTTKLRVVFNASSSTANGRSLNDCLLVGPKLQADISQIVSMWRLHRYVYKADLEKMFRQIRVHSQDLDYQRIIWSPSAEQEPSHFQLLTVTYGTSSAPFLANRVLLQLAKDEGLSFPAGKEILENNFYVDDVFFGADDTVTLQNQRQELAELVRKGGFTLHKWASNEPTLLNQDFSLLDDHQMIFSPQSVLGITWSPSQDAFSFTFKASDSPCVSKRIILGQIARLYDPLGWITPVIIVAKILLQDLWISGVGWDDELPLDLHKRWVKFQQELSIAQNFKIPRWLGLLGNIAYELHAFADASSRAYAAIVYIRVMYELDEARVSLLMAKSKVAPIKTISIPRLELCGAVLLARLLSFVRTNLQFSHVATYAWTDSKVVLAWLRKHPSAWQVFVANRVSEIHTLLPNTQWRHVPSKENPADLASRGVSPSELINHSLWLNGPSWLTKHSVHWPHSDQCADRQEVEVEASKTILSSALFCKTPDFSLLELPSLLSSWPKLLRVTRLVLHAVDKFLTKIRTPKETADFTPYAAMQRTRTFWFKLVQEEAFAREIQALRKGETVMTNSTIKKLHPFLDEAGLLRVGGRLQNSLLSFSEKHPVILPQHRVTELLAQHTHIKTLHGGLQLTVRVLRQEFWIIRLRSLMKRIIHRCVVCTRYKAELGQQLMGNLPSVRVQPSRPFSRVGVDYAGPYFSRSSKGRGNKSHKSYVALFVCLCTRAIHIELVTDYSTSGFLAALKRFVARRGLPAIILSDNGTNFHGADNELRRAWKEVIRSNALDHYCDTERIQWQFIPPGAPHFGGIWEAGVKSVKFHLRRVVGEHNLTFEELYTLLCQVEASLNSRPLSALSDDPDDLACLTPGHFLIGAPLLSVPEPSLLFEKETYLTRWKLIQKMHEQFWQRWSTEYLHSMQQRPKWLNTRRNFAVGDLVLVRDQNSPPSKWRLGRILECVRGQDDCVRVVLIRTSQGQIQRPVTQICRLPVPSPPCDGELKLSNDEKPCEQSP